jgi:hypothetical protein
MSERSRSLVEAVDRLRESKTPEGKAGIEFPRLAIGPYEEVFVFEVAGHVVLYEVSGPDWDAYFHINGTLLNLSGTTVDGGTFETVFPLKFSLAPQILTWPPIQGAPFVAPPVNGALTDGYGFSKSNFVLGEQGTIVTVGPSIGKFTKTKGGGAQLWVTSVGVTTYGSGRFAGVRGMGAFNGSGYYASAPDLSTSEGRKQLRDGFAVKVSINLKVIGGEDLDVGVTDAHGSGGPTAPGGQSSGEGQPRRSK